MNDATPLIDIPDLLGITYRQADFWTRTDLISSKLVDRIRSQEVHPRFKANGWQGTGLMRVVEPDELEVMALMADLVHAGMLPKAAAALARRLMAEPVGEVTIGQVLLAYRPEQASA